MYISLVQRKRHLLRQGKLNPEIVSDSTVLERENIQSAIKRNVPIDGDWHILGDHGFGAKSL